MGCEELDDRYGRLNSRDRWEEERIGKLVFKELIYDFLVREKEEDDRFWRLRLGEEKGKKLVLRDFIDEIKLGGSKVEDLVDRVKGIGRDSGLDLFDDVGRLKGKYGKVVMFF